MGGQTFDYPGEDLVGDLERKVASGAAQPRVIRDTLALRQTLRMAVESLTERLRMADEDIRIERARSEQAEALTAAAEERLAAVERSQAARRALGRWARLRDAWRGGKNAG